MGGASGYVSKLAKKWAQVLFPVWTSYSSQYPMPPGPLKDVMDMVEKHTDLSGNLSVFFLVVYCADDISVRW